MGKPFETEIDALPTTYAWALTQAVDDLARAVERLQPHPLLAVGSGGSFSVSHFAAHLHGILAGKAALPMTPLQAVAQRSLCAGVGVILPTAGGNNPDVLAAVRLLAEQEPHSILILCGNARSRVAARAAQYKMVDCITYDLPAGKDGFLATNSLLAFCVLLARAYSAASGRRPDLPKHYRELLGERESSLRSTSAHAELRDLLHRGTLLVLHGPATASGAVDIESKFAEAALGNVQVCDYRQFAHGRHHWLAKRAAESAVLSLESQDEQTVASQTLALLPASVPAQRVRIPHRGWLANLAALTRGLYLVSAAGRCRGIDPGRPGVPSFGRKLYHSNAFRERSRNNGVTAWRARAVERKAAETLEQLTDDDRLTFWLGALGATLAHLSAARFGAIVFDYDGTLCSEDHRLGPLPSSIAQALSDLTAAGITIGIATGRGKSVRTRLREALPRKYWRQVVVGYYNGSQILSLNSNAVPDGSENVGEELMPVARALGADRLLAQGTLTLRPKQITLDLIRGMSLEALHEHVEAIANRVATHPVRVMRSGHSVDVVPASVSKLEVVAHIQKTARIADTDAVLRIGDRGRWPGNDAHLLASPYGLSVHEVSSDPETCWNLAPAGFRGSQATLWYLGHLKMTKQGLRFDLKGMTP